MASPGMGLSSDFLAESSYCQGETLEAAARVNRYASFKTFNEIVIITTQQTSCIVLPRYIYAGRNVCLPICLSVKRVNCDKTKETYDPHAHTTRKMDASTQ